MNDNFCIAIIISIFIEKIKQLLVSSNGTVASLSTLIRIHLKKSLFLALSLFSSLLFAQKEKTLFWEISGNGLAKKSYIYGTMHVSDKISYHLSDSFFKNLLNADIVSNESDPETWDEIYSVLRTSEIEAPYNFYTSFYMTPLKKKELSTIFTNNNYFTSMLSGLEGAQSDYQENTVLDMFINQTGRKYKKRIVGLESAKESLLSIMKIKPQEAKPDEKNMEKLMKLIKYGNFNETLKTFYREKDIVMLDSLYKLMFSKKAHNVLITNRNKIMVHSIDSLARTGSLFSAVGAAHLAGKEGILQLLIDKGYTVNPIFDDISTDGQKQKKAIEDYFPKQGFITKSTTDEMIQMPLNKKIIRSGENIGSPDFTNGGVINIKRILLNDFLNKKNERFNPKALDSLFYENIAGEINEKTDFHEQNYSGYDIRNTTKSGNTQHWRFYITPLELIAVSMNGPGNYTHQFEKEVFDNIKIKDFKPSWEKVTPLKGGFSVEVPSFKTVYGNTEGELSNTEIQAYDNGEKAYYFLTESTLKNTDYLEDTAFEHKQIHFEFYLQHQIDSTNVHYDPLKESLTSESKIGSKRIQLKSVIHGNKYYLLGSINASDNNTKRFFDSFQNEKFNYTSPTKVYVDSLAQFDIEIPEKPNQKLFLKIDKDDSDYKSKNKFSSKSIYYTFQSDSGNNVELSYYKYHKYENEVNLDSIKTRFHNTFLIKENIDETIDDEDYSDNSNVVSLANEEMYSKKGFCFTQWYKLINNEKDHYEILNESSAYDADKNIHTFEALVSKPSATQALKYKVFFNEESETQLTTLVDKNYKGDDPFIEKAFLSFHLKNKNKNSVFDDKLKLFMDDAMSEQDTLRYSAMKSVYELKLNKNDFDRLTQFINTFTFKDTEAKAQETLIEKLGGIEDHRVIPYLEDLYKKEGTKTALQLSILSALTYQKNKLAYKTIGDLLEYDLPLSDNEYDIYSLFNDFENDLENSKELFPRIFQFYSIKEYNQPIISFCNKLFDQQLVAPKKLNSFKKIILTNAKLEYKRILSWKEKNPTETTDDSTPDEPAVINDEIAEPAVTEVEVLDSVEEADITDAPVEDLISYLSLISHFPQEEATTNLIEKIKKLDLPQLNVELLRLGVINNQLSEDEIQQALHNPKTEYIMIQLLMNQNKSALIGSISEEEIAQSALNNFNNIKEKDTTRLVSKQTVENNGNLITYFFFEVIKKVEEDKVPKKELYSIAFINQDNKINPLAYKTFFTKEIKDSDKLEEQCKNVITQSLNEKHLRALFQKEEEGNTLLPSDY